MRVRPLIALLALAAASIGATFPATDTVPLQRAIVAFDGDALPAGLEATLDALDVRGAVAFETINAVAVTAPPAAIRALADRADVRSIRAERRLDLHLYQSVAQMDADPETVEATFAGKPFAKRAKALDGAGAVVAVLDTGIWAEHPDLQGQVLAHRNFELGWAAHEMMLSAEELDAYAELSGQGNRIDDIGHGTHVGGTVAGTGAVSAGRPNAGVAPGAKLVDLRIAAGPIQGLVEDTGWERNAIAAFDWIIRHRADEDFGPHGIRVNTNSWGLTGGDLIYGAPSYDPLAEIIRKVVEADVVTIFSAGNDGAEDNVTEDTIPNGMPEVVSVAAACKDDATTSACDPEVPGDIADFSSRGPAVDVGAPGVEIVAPVFNPSLIGVLSKPGVFYGGHFGDSPDQDAQNRFWYGAASGTSMAAPHVAGLAALILGVNPELSESQVRDLIIRTADARKEPDPKQNAWGAGMVDANEAMARAALTKGR